MKIEVTPEECRQIARTMQSHCGLSDMAHIPEKFMNAMTDHEAKIFKVQEDICGMVLQAPGYEGSDSGHLFELLSKVID